MATSRCKAGRVAMVTCDFGLTTAHPCPCELLGCRDENGLLYPQRGSRWVCRGVGSREQGRGPALSQSLFFGHKRACIGPSLPMRKGTAITGHLNRVGGLQEERKYEALSPPCGKAHSVVTSFRKSSEISPNTLIACSLPVLSTLQVTREDPAGWPGN